MADTNTKTTIELNGTLYDATTGSAVGARAEPTVIRPKSAVNMDGFIRSKSNAPAKPVKPVTVEPAAAKTPKNPKTPHNAEPAQARQPQRAQTLMRHSIKKPVVKAPPSQEKPASQEAKAALPSSATKERHHRAKHTPKSPAISRFGGRLSHELDKTVDHLPVVQAPPKPAAPVKSFSSHTPHHAPKTGAAEPFAAALANATSHEQPAPKKPRLRKRSSKRISPVRRAISIGAASLAVVLLAGFIAYQSVPNFQMRLAATRAGFSASMPGAPNGFSPSGSVQASPGEVTISFRSNSDDRSFQVTQKPSNWTSESLLSNYVAVNNQPYQTYEDRGKTIYIYNGSNATWVNGGIWYQVDGNSSLNSDQLLHIANSF